MEEECARYRQSVRGGYRSRSRWGRVDNLQLGQRVGLIKGSCGRTWGSVIGDLVMLVIVYTFNDINLSVLRAIL